MNNSKETLKRQQIIRRPYGEVSRREHLPVALQEVADLATCGQEKCENCVKVAGLVKSMQQFIRENSEVKYAEKISAHSDL